MHTEFTYMHEYILTFRNDNTPFFSKITVKKQPLI